MSTPIATPELFALKWKRVEQKEISTYISHFEDLCRLVGHALPHDHDPKGSDFGYQIKVNTGEGHGFADVWYKGHFAFEYKTRDKYKDFKEAFQQLRRYISDLYNPPLLVVTDISHWEIQTNFNDTQPTTYRFTNAELADNFHLIRALFNDPYALHPGRTTIAVTEEAAAKFKDIADDMRETQPDQERIARFLTKLIFCLFCEDVGLLPRMDSGRGIFADIVRKSQMRREQFKTYLGNLFEAMAQGGNVLMADVRYFNGALFADAEVEGLGVYALKLLDQACDLNWSSVAPAVFGTLFERVLDSSKRAQLGAHYTGKADILEVIKPVLLRPLEREWDAILAQAQPLRAALDAATTPKQRIDRANDLMTLRAQMLERLATITVLDPACGSGNFLYVSLQELMNFEKVVLNDPVWVGLTQALPGVHPRQLYGIETNPIAHALASIVVWIGYFQWRRDNGYPWEREPVLERLDENIICADAIMRYDADGKPYEPDWHPAEVIVGNPPFLGDRRMRGELGDVYVDALRQLYEKRVPGGADLVCYWFEKARAQIAAGKTKRAGLLATNSIRGGANREVLKRIKNSGDIFMAWADRAWILEGAAVRISIIGFDNGSEERKALEGVFVKSINPDLTGDIDITKSKPLSENSRIAFIGTQKSGPFDIPAEKAEELLRAVNPSEKSNYDVVRRYYNGEDITDGVRDVWAIDFAQMSIEEAAQYELPFNYVKEKVYPIRLQVRREAHKRKWWLYGEVRPGMRHALEPLPRYIITPRVSKHRVMSWVNSDVIPDSAVVAFARSDDYFFGVLHSYLHEVWSLRMGTSLEDRPRYTPTTTFETFPFPFSPGKEDTASPNYAAVAAAAKALADERAAWMAGKGKDRTLTNLYNALAVWRGLDKGKTKPDAADFAPRLAELHDALDAAVLAAYGWGDLVGRLRTPDGDEDILRRLLALNLSRSGQPTPL
jgi:type II restriction/modification system DNA methylase subunit YeeA